MKQGVPDSVSDNISSYVMCDNCSNAINILDNMSNRNPDIDIRDT